MTAYEISAEPHLPVGEFQRVLVESGLGERRPVSDVGRLERMLRGSDLLLTARRDGLLVGVARAVTDHAYCCYLSDLAVVRSEQRHGVGKQLLEQMRMHIGPEVSLILSSAPDAVAFYEKINMPVLSNCFWYRRET